MKQAMSTFMARVPARSAREAVPGCLAIGRAELEISPESTAEAAFYGREARRFPARWTNGPASGSGYVEIRPTSKTTAEIAVALEAPEGLFQRVVASGPRRSALAQLFARGLRYEVETRAGDGADGLDARRTSRELVRARTA